MYIVDASPGVDFTQATIPVQAGDMAWNATRQGIYATANSDTGGISQSLLVIDPTTANIEQVVSLGQGSYPTSIWSGWLALSGSRTVTPTTPGTFVYDLSCQNPASAVQKVVTLTVTAPATGGGGSRNLLDLSALCGVALMGLGKERRRSEKM